MPLIMNCSCMTQTVTAFGNHFTLPPGKPKNFTDNIANFLSTERAEQGLVLLPDEFLEPEFSQSDEGKKILAQKKAEGVAARIRKLKQLAYNETVSLKQDLDKANLKVDPRSFMSEAAIGALEELAKYLDNEEASKKEQISRVRALEARIGKVEKED